MIEKYIFWEYTVFIAFLGDDVMKYVFQFGLILAITFVAEMIYRYLPLPVPASIYGLVIMLFLLVTGIIRLDWVKESARYLILIMPLMFIPAGAKLVTMGDIILPVLLPVLFTVFVTTIIVMVISGRVTQFIIKKESENDK